MKYIVANWKMNMNLEEVTRWLYNFGSLLKEKEINNTVVLAASFPHAERVSKFTKENEISCGMQDVSTFEKGAHTGEVGAFQMKDFTQYCIVGHSERKEDEKTVLAKRDACLLHGITPIVCFTNPDKIDNYLKEGALLAWEDPENISKGGKYREKNPQDIEDTFAVLKEKAPEAIILYGGSVHKDNVDLVSQIESIDGVLVGNASLDPKHFMKIISAFK